MHKDVRKMQICDETVLQQKQHILHENLLRLGSVAIAYSSGVDSTFLLKTAHDLMGNRVIAVTVESNLFPQREQAEARRFCEMEKIRHIVCHADELKIVGFCENPKNRCYLCKMELFCQMKRIAVENGMAFVAEGSNLDDLGDYRPGLQAIDALEIQSPLRKAGFTKQDIRQLSKQMGLSTWKKPSIACLASRVPYGEMITAEKLAMVEQAEQFLLDLGFQQFRVRIHGKMARIEVLPEALERLVQAEIREQILSAFHAYGFTYVSMDLQGYRMGSMNEALSKAEKSIALEESS